MENNQRSFIVKKAIYKDCFDVAFYDGDVRDGVGIVRNPNRFTMYGIFKDDILSGEVIIEYDRKPDIVYMGELDEYGLKQGRWIVFNLGKKNYKFEVYKDDVLLETKKPTKKEELNERINEYTNHQTNKHHVTKTYNNPLVGLHIAYTDEEEVTIMRFDTFNGGYNLRYIHNIFFNDRDMRSINYFPPMSDKEVKTYQLFLERNNPPKYFVFFRDNDDFANGVAKEFTITSEDEAKYKA